MVEKVSQKMSEDAIKFTDNLNTNMIRDGVIDKALHRTDVWDRIVRYFKLNNNRYIELVRMEDKK